MNITVREGQSLQFRAEFFDLFNHPDFGKILSAVARIVQFALKFVS